MAKVSTEKAVTKRGLRGASGKRGAGSPSSVTGRAGPSLKRADVLAMVEDQFMAIRKEMALQLARMGPGSGAAGLNSPDAQEGCDGEHRGDPK